MGASSQVPSSPRCRSQSRSSRSSRSGRSAQSKRWRDLRAGLPAMCGRVAPRLPTSRPRPSLHWAPVTQPENRGTFSFQHQRSGNCCARPQGFVRVSQEDVARIATHLGLSKRAFRSRYVAADGRRLVERQGGGDIFLEAGQPASCRIHPVRPARCRSWPFWPELLDDPPRCERPGDSVRHPAAPGRKRSLRRSALPGRQRAEALHGEIHEGTNLRR